MASSFSTSEEGRWTASARPPAPPATSAPPSAGTPPSAPPRPSAAEATRCPWEVSAPGSCGSPLAPGSLAKGAGTGSSWASSPLSLGRLTWLRSSDGLLPSLAVSEGPSSSPGSSGRRLIARFLVHVALTGTWWVSSGIVSSSNVSGSIFSVPPDAEIPSSGTRSGRGPGCTPASGCCCCWSRGGVVSLGLHVGGVNFQGEDLGLEAERALAFGLAAGDANSEEGLRGAVAARGLLSILWGRSCIASSAMTSKSPLCRLGLRGLQ
mmetsp:Transcript_37400/g.116246  ORF Transcript_37400/g.116246 Transcript_37400/m.116246 type:complete len:265 (-) Transcript_37400:773-1567(-)